jgi:hypothetical protein
MSNLEGSFSPSAEDVGSGTRSDRLRVITAGHVGNMDARLGTSGFDVVAAAETENALIDAVSGDEPDAIVVEADLCASLELVRDLAPDAVVIVVGDHTPPGALGRVERGMSGTAMAGLLHALVAEGVGAAVVWGLVPTFRAGAFNAPQRVGLSLLSANADLVRAHLASALRDPAQLLAVAGTVALTVSASLLVTLSGPRTHDRPEPVPAPTVERAQQHPVVAPSPSARTPAQSHSGSQGELGDRRDPNHRESTDPGRHADQGESQGESEDNNDQGQNQNNDQGENEDANDQGENQDDADQGRDNAQQGENQDNNDQGEKQDGADQDENQDGRKRRAPGSSMAFGVAPSGPREARGT